MIADILTKPLTTVPFTKGVAFLGLKAIAKAIA